MQNIVFLNWKVNYVFLLRMILDNIESDRDFEPEVVQKWINLEIKQALQRSQKYNYY